MQELSLGVTWSVFKPNPSRLPRSAGRGGGNGATGVLIIDTSLPVLLHLSYYLENDLFDVNCIINCSISRWLGFEATAELATATSTSTNSTTTTTTTSTMIE